MEFVGAVAAGIDSKVKQAFAIIISEQEKKLIATENRSTISSLLQKLYSAEQSLMPIPSSIFKPPKSISIGQGSSQVLPEMTSPSEAG